MATVLIIDGDVAVAQSLKDALSASGVKSIVTGDGTEGLGLAKADPPDVIVLCVELSRVSGYSICNKLKKDPSLAGVPLVLTSSQATEETFEQHKKLRTRADAYVKKPFDVPKVLEIIGKYVPIQSAAPAAEVDVEEDVDLAVAEEDPPAATREARGESAAATPASRSRGAAAAKAARSLTTDLDDLLGDSVAPTKTREPAAAPAGRDDEVLGEPEEELVPEADEAADSGAVAGVVDEDVLGDESGLLGADSDLGAGRAASPPSEVARRPAAARRSRPRSSAAAATSASDAATEQMRAESQKLRLRVKELEQTLHDKELEFNDRLLKESTRSREGVELKKKVTQLERELSKHRQAEERAREETAGAREELQQMQAEITASDEERQSLSDKLAQLVDKVKSVTAERDGLREELEAEQEARRKAEQDLDQAAAVRQKAKKAVDIAVQLIDETGL